MRPVGSGDLEAFHRLLTDPFVYRYLLDGQVLERSGTAAYVARSEQTFASWGYGLWLIRAAEREDILGFAGLVGRGDLPPSLLYGLLPSCTGQGLAREAARAVVHHAAHVLTLPAIHADVDVVNADSVTILEELGFRSVGTRQGAFGVVRDYLLELDAA